MDDLRKLAEGGDKFSQHLMGKLYRDGGLVIPDWMEACFWFDQAARNGLVASQYALGKLYLTADPEIRDVQIGMAWLEYANKSGSVDTRTSYR